MPDAPNIQQLFPDRVFTQCCRIEDKHYALHREEATAVKKAVASRRNEFGAGRMCARSALENLGIRERVLARKSDGSTAWPPGIVGAISHSDSWCGAAVARQSDYLGVGFDIETADRVTSSIARRVLTDSEMDWVGRQAEDESRKWFTLIFSAKESIYKCLPPFVGKSIRFRDAEIVPHAEDSSFEVRLTDRIVSRIPSFLPLRGRYLLYGGEVFTGIVLTK
ncbi:MAG: 4'-phosphopantetheinyl transferase superfamily protein [Thermodesulfobacteriota bacterium]|nr:4'-phosphopantetheinyl transferase superfamily protein [Thermodesulfobacteriota bacterium]